METYKKIVELLTAAGLVAYSGTVPTADDVKDNVVVSILRTGADHHSTFESRSPRTSVFNITVYGEDLQSTLNGSTMIQSALSVQSARMMTLVKLSDREVRESGIWASEFVFETRLVS